MEIVGEVQGPAGGEVFGPYRLQALLGRGGMGEVWRAVDTSQADRSVAIKLLGAWLGGDPAFADRFRREAALAARLSGPHIVPIHRFGEIDGRLYIDMPLVDGIDLAALLQRDGPLPPQRAIEILDQVADALDTAHAAGLVHRDVKPSNILATARRGRDHAYLIDFGIARALDGTRHSVSGAVIGSLAYMAPERFDGDGDHRADVYALGCVLHEMLTGRPAFAATSLPSWWRAHADGPRPRPCSIRSELPQRLDGVVARAAAAEPADRFSSAEDMVTAAREAAVAEPAGPTLLRQAARSPLPQPGPLRREMPAVTVVRRPAAGPRTTAPPSSSPTTDPPPSGGPAMAGSRQAVRRALIATVAAVAVAAGVVAAVATANAPATADGEASEQSSVVANPDPPIEERTITLPGEGNAVYSVTTAEIDSRPVIVSGSIDGNLRIWDLATGDLTGSVLTGHTSAVNAVTTASLDGRTIIVSGSSDSTIRVWDLATGEPIGDPLTGHTGPVYAVTTVSIDGRTAIVSGSADDTVRLWDLTSRELIGNPLTGHTSAVNAVVGGPPDGPTAIVSGSADDTVRLWDLTTREPIGNPLTGHSGSVGAVSTAQLADRSAVISGGAAGALRVWDLDTGESIGDRLTGHSGTVRAVTTTQLDGRTVLISGSSDGTIRTWDLAARAAA